MYDLDDPRSALATLVTAAPARPASGSAEPEYIEFNNEEPAEVSAAGSRTWYFRGQNFVLSYTILSAGDSLTREGQAHEYVVLLTEKAANVRIAAGDDSAEVREPAVIVVPPGTSTVTAVSDTVVIRLFDLRTADLLNRASNAASYAEAHPNVAPLTPWPEPAGGPRLRTYFVDRVAATPGRFGRIYRSSSFMVNFLDAQEGPRDPEKLSPHHHDDFEQCSLSVEGTWTHHIRTPWTTKRSQWREDQHRVVGSPSVTIIPPPTVHTSEATGAGRNQLIDIFCPPREDFSATEGWVLNAEDYPQP
jgi:mannose-6-phosphate isomerase-like protein (cupin superfamily)